MSKVPNAMKKARAFGLPIRASAGDSGNGGHDDRIVRKVSKSRMNRPNRITAKTRRHMHDPV